MKAGFKPKLFTKKEWSNNRSLVCQGSGVGKALDVWQKDCSYKLSEMNLDQVKRALSAAVALGKALDVAEKKCKSQDQKETRAGIGEYKKIVNSYKAHLLKASQQLNDKKEFFSDLDIATIEQDKALWKLYGSFFEKKVHSPVQFHTYELVKKKKYAEAVKKYSNNGKGGGAYNMSAKDNRILYNEFVAKIREDKKDIDNAIRRLESGMKLMVHDASQLSAFKAYPLLIKFVDSKHPITDFKI